MAENPYESSEKSPPSTGRRFNRGTVLILFAWIAGAVLPAVTINVMAFVADQSMYGTSAESRKFFAGLTSSLNYVFLISIVLSIGLMWGAIWQANRPLSWKVGICCLSLLVASILLFFGLLATFAITGLPVS